MPSEMSFFRYHEPYRLSVRQRGKDLVRHLPQRSTLLVQTTGQDNRICYWKIVGTT